MTVYRANRVRTHVVAAAVVFIAGGVAILIAATWLPPGEARIVSLTAARGSVVGAESARTLSAGSALFEERGCVGCHRPDGTGTGRTLRNLFGSPSEYSGSGTGVVDESYVRDAILNPAATVALGFSPVMPTFAGQLTETELEALVAYVASLSESVQDQR